MTTAPEPSPEPLLRRLWARRLVRYPFLGALVLSAVLAVLWALAPVGLGYGVERWLRDHGARQVQLGEVELDLFTARFALRGVEMRAGDDTGRLGEISGQLSRRELLKGRVLFQRLVIKGAELEFARRDADGAWQISGIVLPRGAPGEADADEEAIVGIDAIEIAESRARLTLGSRQVRLAIDQARIDGLRPWARSGRSHLTLSGRLDDATVRLTATGTPFAAKPALEGRLGVAELSLGTVGVWLGQRAGALGGTLAASGKIDAVMGEGGPERFVFDGRLRATGARYAVDGDELATAQELAWSGPVRIARANGGGFGLVLDGRIRGRDLGLEADDGLAVSGADLRWTGKLTADTTGAAPALADGSLRLGGFDARLPGDAGRLRIADATLTGRGEVPGGGPPAFEGALSAGDLSYRLPGPHRTVARISAGKAEIGGLAFAGVNDIRAKTLRLSALSLKGPGPEGAMELASAEGISADGVRLGGANSLRIGALSGQSVQAHVSRTDAGIFGPHRLGLSEPAPDDGGRERGDGFAFRIDTLALDAKSSIAFTDATVRPAFKRVFALRRAELDGLDSASASPSRLSLAARVGKYANIEVKGEIAAFAEAPRATLKADVDHIELPPLSPYLEKESGLAFDSGQADIKGDIKIEGSKIDAKTTLALRNMKLSQAQEGALARAGKAIGMSVDAALSLLRDGNNDIRLEVPVSGDLDSPRFDLSGVIAKGVTGALKTASLSFLKYSIQPFGAALMIGELAADLIGAIRLDPILFDPGKHALPQHAAPYLDKVAKLMKDRPSLRLRLCGRATAADRRALAMPPPGPAPSQAPQGTQAPQAPQAPQAQRPVTDEAVAELARARSQAVKAALVGGRGIAPARLFLCKPEIDKDGSALPRVDLLI